MLRLLFLIPAILCLIWYLYLRHNGYTVSQGKQGFKYILIFSAVIGGFYTLLLWLTHL
ncbi:hypothetical protein KJY73_15350 [Bowmanella sp. Y26]|uniref:Succinyl-diaminopimelate desuccinylase n=1 Tax=Bowmanella yangjiangensis TaxID=2811230 RepID=A0ABS3CZT1_9ALTE|nr:hypothetical protein [Bowmanella yangjiangensis]MBN7822059.1 hypothetical protein [Bowmanella yangjiangensis]MBT1064966.1 hypothetical protein [Bowmanella yangjiangensis]